MTNNNEKFHDPSYLELKRKELEVFFQDLKLPKEVIEKAIQNELKPLILEDRPYIAASALGEVKSEYDVMTGQPFTKFEECNRPLTSEEIKELLKDSQVIAEKSKQIQIMIDREKRSEIVVPIEEIKLPGYEDMRKEIDSASSSSEVNKINYKNMASLLHSVNAYEVKYLKATINPKSEKNKENSESDSDEKDLEAIEKVVSQYSDKSYETRYQETKDMLLKLADRYEDPNADQSDAIFTPDIENVKILKESSVQFVKGQKRRSAFEEVKESYSINAAMNISLTDNPVKPNLSGEVKKVTANKIEEENISYEEVFPKTFEAKLKDTEKALRDINSVLNNAPVTENSSRNSPNTNEIQSKSERENISQKFDENMEQTLQTALEDIFQIDKQNRENRDMEFKEMKSLARNIVEGAENLSTLIREDITNKLNSMNELLNDVNEALENSRKSNIAYQKIKEEGDILKRRREVSIVPRENINVPEVVSPTVSSADIDDINSAICNLNAEINHHEDRINKCKESYEIRNEECKTFIKEVDDIMIKSRQILHPLQNDVTIKEEKGMKETKKDVQEQAFRKISTDEMKENNAEDHARKELCKNEKNKNLAELENKELERNNRINDLLYEIKDKMKDNKEVLRLANNLLRREETRKSPLVVGKVRELPAFEMDEEAQGDHKRETNMSVCPPDKNEFNDKQDLEKEKTAAENAKAKQREFQQKIEKEMEEMNKGLRMTKEFIKNHCKQHKLYCTPYLNDILYLHFKGFSKIENLDEYTGLKCIFLENNGIERIEGLDTLSELKCLYLHYNVVRKIENLTGCPKLDTLNLDHNFIRTIDNLDAVPDLHTLSIAHNMLTTVDDLEHLKLCKNLSVLDLSYNRLEDPLIVDVLSDMIMLKVLVLTGNPVVKNIPAYRKTLTLRLKELLNLDNRPVFPRDRACAEAWQRGGVQEEIAERKRWIARDQEKVMQSVRYLINMRDQKRAERDAREREEREKLGLPPKVEGNPIGQSNIQEIGSNSDESSPEVVVTKGGVVVDMLSGSEAEGSTTEDSSEESGDDDKSEPDTKKIEWSQLDKGRCLVQEIDNQPPVESGDQWSGYTGHVEPRRGDFASDFQALNNLLYNQEPHVERRGVTKILESAKKHKEQDSKIDYEKTISNTIHVEKKPLIEIIEAGGELCGNKVLENEDTELNDTECTEQSPRNSHQETKSGASIPENTVHPRPHEDNANNSEALITKKDLESECTSDCSRTTVCSQNDESDKMIREADKDIIKTMSTITIREIPLNDTKDESRDQVECKDKENGGGSEFNRSLGDKKPAVHSQGEGTALINYMQRINNADCDGDDEDLKPSAEDLEIFAELEREQVERQARIDRGEPAVNPMKLYDKKVMEEFYKDQDLIPAHEIRERVMTTSYSRDNAFDRIALSQLTGGEVPDKTKMTLTRVPGAVLLHYGRGQVGYQIGEEKFEGGSSVGDPDSSAGDSTDEEKNYKAVKMRPKSAKKNDPRNLEDAVVCNDKEYKEGGFDDDETADGDLQSADETRQGESNEHYSKETRSYVGDEDLLELKPEDAKRSIINAINSYEDDRFPSQGVNYSNMAEDRDIEQSVAAHILERTVQHERDELYRRYDVITSHAGRVDNTTNSIIEHISESLQNEISLPEVSLLIEAHMEAAEQRWRGGELLYVAASPPGSDADDTLVATDVSFEDTLTDIGASDANGAGGVAEAGGRNLADGFGATVEVQEIQLEDAQGTVILNDARVTRDPPRQDAPRQDAPRQDAPRPDSPRQDAPRQDSLCQDAPRQDSPRQDSPRQDAQREVSPRNGLPAARVHGQARSVVDDEVFEDCEDFKVDVNYSIEMKLALGLRGD
ncbi:uncharacterized protein LOC114241453 [Bombyx mandarina]|uniref:Dynein axonemal assembly factor 1 homolog n=1 Tax=Bombyx mandarina TaxID=7092 RepID=A0A6J2JF18_BOMMA|nr:uncharacterized protein LOC114241453 [Bombyx mandarina]